MGVHLSGLEIRTHALNCWDLYGLYSQRVAIETAAKATPHSYELSLMGSGGHEDESLTDLVSKAASLRQASTTTSTLSDLGELVPPWYASCA